IITSVSLLIRFILFFIISALSLHVALSICMPAPQRLLPSFPTRRSSDLLNDRPFEQITPSPHVFDSSRAQGKISNFFAAQDASRDRKSTRLNSSHVSTSYAVFCLKKQTSELH